MTTTLGTLAWIPALVLMVVAFVLVGVVAGATTLSVWAYRSLSPARTRPRDSAEVLSVPPRDESAAETSGRARRPRRVVRDRTVGYDA